MSEAQFVPYLLINQSFKLHIYMFSMKKVKASHNSAQVQNLYESYFLLLKKKGDISMDWLEKQRTQQERGARHYLLDHQEDQWEIRERK